MTTAKDYFRKKLGLLDCIDDYTSLAQSPDTTRARHLFALSMMQQDDLVMDVGCGTGLLLHSMRSMGLQPSHYRGLDMFEEVIEIARKRADAMHLASTFVHVKGSLTHEIEARRADMVFCLGVMGYGDGSGDPDDFTTPHRVGTVLKILRSNSLRGAVSLPLAAPPAKDEDGFHRFTVNEVMDIASKAGGLGLHQLDNWNLMIYWR